MRALALPSTPASPRPASRRYLTPRARRVAILGGTAAVLGAVLVALPDPLAALWTTVSHWPSVAQVLAWSQAPIGSPGLAWGALALGGAAYAADAGREHRRLRLQGLATLLDDIRVRPALPPPVVEDGEVHLSRAEAARHYVTFNRQATVPRGPLRFAWHDRLARVEPGDAWPRQMPTGWQVHWRRMGPALALSDRSPEAVLLAHFPMLALAPKGEPLPIGGHR